MRLILNIRKNKNTLFIKHDWEREEILQILNMPLIDLMWRAQNIHREFNEYSVQLASLFSVKTGGCEEDCAYCSQSIYSGSDVSGQPDLGIQQVIKGAIAAKKAGYKISIIDRHADVDATSLAKSICVYRGSNIDNFLSDTDLHSYIKDLRES